MSDHPIYLNCPHCGKETTVVAKATNVKRLETTVTRTDCLDLSSLPMVDWGEAYIDADISFHCAECGAKLGDFLEDVVAIMRRQEAQ